MRVVVKALKGGQDSIEIKDLSVTIRELKRAYESHKNIKISPNDKLLFKGKSLADGNTLESYGIKDGDKLHFIATATATGSSPASTGSSPASTVRSRSFWDLMRQFLLKHFTEADTNKIIDHMKQEIRGWIYGTPLEMIEQTAISNLEIAKS